MGAGIDMREVHHGGLDPAVEGEMIARAAEMLRSASGQAVAGWHSPGHSQSGATLALLAANGFRYVGDWVNDDMPYTIATERGRLQAMPISHELSDRLLMVHYNQTIEDYAAQVLGAFERLSVEGAARGGRILALSVSPWVIGYPHRIAAFAAVLRTILDSGKVWAATGAEIVAHLAKAEG